MKTEEAKGMLRELSEAHPGIFATLRGDALSMEKEAFIEKHLPNVPAAAMSMGKKLSPKAQKKLLSVGWTMVRRRDI